MNFNDTEELRSLELCYESIHNTFCRAPNTNTIKNNSNISMASNELVYTKI